MEYRPDLNPRSSFHQEADGLHLRVMRAQRLRDSDSWPYPTVIRLTNVDTAFTPPTVHTLPATLANGVFTLHGDWSDGKDTPEARFGFDYRIITGEDTQSRLHAWQSLPTRPASHPRAYSLRFTPLPRERYEVRAVLRHPLMTIYGESVVLPIETQHKSR